MPIEIIGEYEIEYAGVPLTDVEGWAAHAAIFGPSRNPMHRNIIFPDQRVCVDIVFPNRAEAEAEALKVAKEMIK
jgi:hypothetical protein